MAIKPEIIGKQLATEVTIRLECGNVLAHDHRDYCGMGLRYAEGYFIYSEVYDGQLPLEGEVKNWQEAGDVERKSFNSRSAFINWLAKQSDESLSGKELANAWLHGNQRLTLERLKCFVDPRRASGNS